MATTADGKRATNTDRQRAIERAARRTAFIDLRNCLEAWRMGAVTDPLQQLEIMNLAIDVLNKEISECGEG